MELIVALGLVLVIEGCIYALFPGPLKRMMEMAQGMPDGSLRLGGLVAAGLGVLIVWLAHG